MKSMISNEILLAYTQCKLKAYLFLFTDRKGTQNEYVSILEKETIRNREEYFSLIKKQTSEFKYYSLDNMKNGIPILLNADLEFNNLKAYLDIITKIGRDSSNNTSFYIPILIAGTHKISKELKFQLAFIGYVLFKIQEEKPIFGIIIDRGKNDHEITLEPFYKEIEKTVRNLNTWIQDSSLKSPPVILNKHCTYCQFKKDCEEKAVEKNDLSLLSGLSIKNIQKYHNKGIFSVEQLSYLFRPRKQAKGSKKSKFPLRYRPELQALAIRTEKIYIQELPKISKNAVELFLDIEGVPDQDLYYLIGLLVSSGEEQLYYYFWADSTKNEQKIWDSFIEEVNKYPNASIYHYGDYDLKAIKQLKKRYGKESDIIETRLINATSLVYAKIYFPVKSNNLKELGRFLGAVWTDPNASGLQSLVWRYHWDESQNEIYRQLLLTYNKEDCNALYLLVKKISEIIEVADSNDNIDFADQPKKHTTTIGRQIHKELENILKFSHADYDKNKIIFESNEKIKEVDQKKHGGQKGHQAFQRVLPASGTVVKVKSRQGACPRKNGQCGWLEESDQIVERIIIDIDFNKDGCRKKVIKYVGNKAYCNKCHSYFLPPVISKLEGRQIFGHNFQAWVIYQRVFLRIPYEKITQIMQDFFGESISLGTIPIFIRSFAKYYLITENKLIQSILESPFIHADETIVSVQGSNQYVWVFTDGKHVVFRKTETRESLIVHEVLSNYNGILISDFHPGYDSVKCRQQKCWSHLIRDINDDLWKEPFNEEFEFFVLQVKNLIVPIIQSIQTNGSKKNNLEKFKIMVEKFYRENVDTKNYTFEVTNKYQKRFQRYKDSLFTFLEQDDIPWNNNAAERAIRHLAVQRKISGTFYDSLISQYLLLLGIGQSCRFQNKSFLKFLLSEEKDVDLFKTPEIVKHTKPFKTDTANKSD
jgi:predicted RecB family nuclease